jgi:hypothetical protein
MCGWQQAGKRSHTHQCRQASCQICSNAKNRGGVCVCVCVCVCEVRRSDSVRNMNFTSFCVPKRGPNLCVCPSSDCFKEALVCTFLLRLTPKLKWRNENSFRLAACLAIRLVFGNEGSWCTPNCCVWVCATIVSEAHFGTLPRNRPRLLIGFA